MLSEILIYRRGLKKITLEQIGKLENVKYNDYVMLESGTMRKMSIQMYEALNPIFNFNEQFKNEYVTPYLRYGDVFREKRKELKLSLYDVEDLTGLSHTYLWKIEKNGFKKISYEIFKKIQPVYGITDEENFEPFLLKKNAKKLAFVNDGAFNSIVAEKRLNLKLSQQQVASYIDVHDSLISKIESSKRKTMRVDTAIKLMDVLEFTEEEKQKFLTYK